jgi:hypothetical protein
MTVAAQSVTGTSQTAANLVIDAGGGSGGTNCSGGNVFVRVGDESGTGTVGNFALQEKNAAAPNFQAMELGMYIANSIAAPTGNPSGGGFLYVEGGALKYRGSSGNIVTLAAA